MSKSGGSGGGGCLLVLILLAAIVFFAIKFLGIGIGAGLGLFTDKGDGEGVSQTSAISVSAEETRNKAVSTSTSEQGEKASDENSGAVVKVTVTGNEYLYENQRTSLEDIVKAVSEISGDVVVEITDDNASYSAFTALTKKLDELKIQYIEK